MRIGIDAMFLVSGKGGGIERYLRGLFKGIEKVDKTNEYFIFTNKDCGGAFKLPGNFKEVPSPASAAFRPSKILWEQFILPFQAKRRKIDVMFSPANIAPFLHPFPTVTVMHDMIPFIRPEGFGAIELAALKTLFYLSAKSSNAIITDSKSSKDDIVRIFKAPEEKVRVVYAACDSEAFVPAGARREDLKKYGIEKKYILYVAARRKYKNIDGLVRAYKILKQRHRVEHMLVITGLGGRADEVLSGLVKELGLERDVLFSGFIPDEELPLLYSGADVFVYPSFFEGFGLPVLEAMACGVPVAASNATSVPEVVGDAGLLFNPNDTEDIANSVYRLLTDKILKAKMIEKGFARVKEFSWEKTARETIKILTDVSGKGRP